MKQKVVSFTPANYMHSSSAVSYQPVVPNLKTVLSFNI